LKVDLRVWNEKVSDSVEKKGGGGELFLNDLR